VGGGGGGGVAGGGGGGTGAWVWTEKKRTKKGDYGGGGILVTLQENGRKGKRSHSMGRWKSDGESTVYLLQRKGGNVSYHKK